MMIDIKAVMHNERQMPKHMVLNLFPVKKGESIKLLDFIEFQIENELAILTISLGRSEGLDSKWLSEDLDALMDISMSNNVNVTIFGKWYELPGFLVEKLKKLNNETYDNDKFFLNLCINYDGKTEIFDALKVLSKKGEELTDENLRDHLYSSTFIPPELIIEPGNRFSGTFLWMAPGARIVMLKKETHDINGSDLLKAIDSTTFK